MKFIDEVEIYAKAGDGGAGSSHFRREKYVPLGGPDGGDGGNGGSIIVRATSSKNTLLDFSYKKQWNAGKGEPGAKQLKSGSAGKDIILEVPVGTQIFKLSEEENTETPLLVVDLSADGMEHILAKGGLGGRGNVHFKSATNQAPDYAQPGRPGEEGRYLFSLKLLADVGLVGMPNAGKSTFISVVSAAKPRIADYPFTTLTPNLGVVKAKSGKTFTIADIPGLIPGASEGKGLGRDFLKHIERTGVILHLIDLSDKDNADQAMSVFRDIHGELEAFSKELSEKKTIIVLTKIDAITNENLIKECVELFESAGYTCFAVSSVSRKGLEQCIEFTASTLSTSAS